MDIVAYFRTKQLFVESIFLIGSMLFVDLFLLVPFHFLGISWVYPTIFIVRFFACIAYPW